MAASRENVLAAITKYVSDHGRRAPAKEIAALVGDTLPNTQAMIKSLVAAGQIESSRGRNGGSKPVSTEDAAILAAVDQIADPAPQTDNDVVDQFAALVAQLEAQESGEATA